jgi:methyl-accepting chemotaxis protein
MALTFTQLKNKIETKSYHPASKKLIIRGQDFDSPSISDLILTLYNEQSIQIIDVFQLDFDSSNQVVSATGKADLFNIGSIFVQVEFRLMDENTVALNIRTTDLPDNWTFSSSLPLLSGSLFDAVEIDRVLQPETPPTLFINSDNFTESNWGVSLTPGLNFIGNLHTQSNAFNQIGWMMPAKRLVTAHGPIFVDQRIDHKIDAPHVNIHVAEINFPGAFKDNQPINVGLDSFLEYPNLPEYIQTGLRLKTDVSMNGLPYRITGLIDSEDFSVVQIIGKAENGGAPLPSPEEISRLIGVGNVAESLPKQMQNAVQVKSLGFGLGTGTRKLEYASLELGTDESFNLDIIPDLIGISQPRVLFRVWNPTDEESRSFSCSVSGVLTIGIVDFYVTTTYPSYRFYASMEDGQTIETGQIIDYFSKGAVKPPNLTVSELTITGAFGNPIYWAIAGEIESDWEFKIADKSFAISQLTFNLEKIDKTLTGEFLGKVLIADNYFYVAASQPEANQGWQFTGTQLPGETLDLAKIVQGLLPDGIQLPDAIGHFKVANLVLSFDTKAKTFSLEGDIEEEWTVSIGPKDFTIENIRLHIERPEIGQRSFSGGLSGNLIMGSNQFFISYDFAKGSQNLTATWENSANPLQLEDFINPFDIPMPPMPARPPQIDLEEIIFSISYSTTSTSKSTANAPGGTGANKAFMFTGKSQNMGDIFLLLQKTGTWGFAFGVALPENWSFSNIPGSVGTFMEPLDSLEFSEAFLLISTTENKSLTIPNFPAMKGQPVIVQPGISIGAYVDFGQSSDSLMQQAGSIVPEETLLQATFAKPISNSSVYVILPGAVEVPVGPESFELSNANLVLTPKAKSFGMKGTLTIPLEDNQVTASGMLTISPDKITATMSIEGTEPILPAPMGLKGIHLYQFGVLLGATYKPPSINIGMQGKFYIGPTEPSTVPYNDYSFVFVLSVGSGAVRPLVLGCQASEITFEKAVEAVLDENLNLPKFINDLKITNLSFFWCQPPEQQLLPDGSMATPGLGFNGNLDFFGLQAFVSANVSATSHITGDAYMSPVNIKDILTITGDGKDTPDNYKGTQIKSGGPFFHIGTEKSPYLHASCKVTLFDFVSSSMEAQINDNGFQFSIDNEVGNASYNLSCAMKDWSEFYGSGGFDFDEEFNVGPIRILGNNLGSFSVKAKFNGSLKIEFNETEFKLTLSGSFLLGVKKLGKINFTLPAITINIFLSKFKEIPEKAVEYVKDDASRILSSLFQDYKKWIKAVGEDIHKFGDDIGKVLKNHFGLRFQQISRELNKIGYSVNQITAALKYAGFAVHQIAGGLKIARFGPNQIAYALNYANYPINQIARALRITRTPAKQIASALKSVKFTSHQIAGALKSLRFAPYQIANALKNAGYPINQIAGALKSARIAGYKIASALKSVKFTSHQIARALKSLRFTPYQIAFSLKYAKYPVNQIAGALKSARIAGYKIVLSLKRSKYSVNLIAGALMSARFAPYQIANALKNAGYPINQIAGALKYIRSGVNQIASALKHVRYGINQIASALYLNRYSNNEIVSALKSVGYTIFPITGALKHVGYFLYQIGAALKNAGFTANQIARALKNGGYQNFQISDALKNAGYAISQITRALKDAGYSIDQIASALKTVAYTANQITNALKNINNQANHLASALKSAGYAVNQIASALKSVSYSNNQITRSLKNLNYSAKNIARALKSVGSGARDIVSSLKYVSFAAQAIKSALTQLGYAASYVENLLRQFGFRI